MDGQAWAETVVRGLRTRFPWGSAHTASGADDCDVTPEVLHPSFHGCLDWHSSAHMQWSAVTLLDGAAGELDPDTAAALVAELDARLAPDPVAVEAAYLRAHPGYERPYGWGWAALLVAATETSAHPHAPAWRAALQPLADVVFDHLLAWLPRLAYPVRSGEHPNTAFGLSLCLDAARALGRDDVVVAVADRARELYGADVDYPTRWEPSGNDFLSPALCEAMLMRRVLPADELGPWLAAFLPRLGQPGDPLLEVPRVLDRTDGKLVHLFGLALSRAWALRELAPTLPGDARARVLARAAEQVAAVQPEISAGDFMSTHWLVSFALRAELA